MGPGYCAFKHAIAYGGRANRFIRPFLTGVTTGIARAEKYLKPVIEDRERQIKEHGRDYPGKPVRMLLMNKMILILNTCLERPVGLAHGRS